MALLHDLGKIGVPNEIINSTMKLTDDEYAVIKTHPGLGSDILSEIKSRPDLVIGARWHHEKYDGKGYPDGKNGEEFKKNEGTQFDPKIAEVMISIMDEDKDYKLHE